jgi:hypothetical protein
MKNAAIAAISGGIVGAAVGFWSPRQNEPPAQVSQSVATIVEPILPTRAAPPSLPAPGPPRPRTSTGEGRSVVERARDYAERADVAALLALRGEIVRRSAQRGEAESPAIRSELEEVDRYVTAARQLRLKLDGEQLQKPF